ncbi:chorismate mutase [Bacillus clarus]|uniref:Chorismate mutase n=1 Tax=Bacillus clarus TaxID=2338372 RepID=A0A090YYL8_9BACI|nr:hypothetical protein [Bacillus clarus]KFN03030.1 hypothetical protein DJ93_4783 [Bacillus clarus]RFT67564.1 chorismate mutase [Bacillus clarus]
MLLDVKAFAKATGLTVITSLGGDISFAIHFENVKNTISMFIKKMAYCLQRS